MLPRLWSLLLVLLASSLVVTATVHAREIPGPATIECSGTIHSEGGADRAQGDADKAMPHHHGTCHGQAQTLPTAQTLSTFQSAGLRPLARTGAASPSHPVDPALRPPTA